jgi:hypothetical protein
MLQGGNQSVRSPPGAPAGPGTARAPAREEELSLPSRAQRPSRRGRHLPRAVAGSPLPHALPGRAQRRADEPVHGGD